jgi:hypothetical protein
VLVTRQRGNPAKTVNSFVRAMRAIRLASSQHSSTACHALRTEKQSALCRRAHQFAIPNIHMVDASPKSASVRTISLLHYLVQVPRA